MKDGSDFGTSPLPHPIGRQSGGSLRLLQAALTSACSAANRGTRHTSPAARRGLPPVSLRHPPSTAPPTVPPAADEATSEAEREQERHAAGVPPLPAWFAGVLAAALDSTPAARDARVAWSHTSRGAAQHGTAVGCKRRRSARPPPLATAAMAAVGLEPVARLGTGQWAEVWEAVPLPQQQQQQQQPCRQASSNDHQEDGAWPWRGLGPAAAATASTVGGAAGRVAVKLVWLRDAAGRPSAQLNRVWNREVRALAAAAGLTLPLSTMRAVQQMTPPAAEKAWCEAHGRRVATAPQQRDLTWPPLHATVAAAAALPPELLLQPCRALPAALHPLTTGVVTPLGGWLSPCGSVGLLLLPVLTPLVSQPAGARSLQAWLQRTALPLLRGLATLHAAGIAHRDVKPDNLLAAATSSHPPNPSSAVDTAGATACAPVRPVAPAVPAPASAPPADKAAAAPCQLLLTDLGMASAAHATHRLPSSTVGALLYCPPEWLRARRHASGGALSCTLREPAHPVTGLPAAAAADVWAAGATLLDLLVPAAAGLRFGATSDGPPSPAAMLRGLTSLLGPPRHGGRSTATLAGMHPATGDLCAATPAAVVVEGLAASADAAAALQPCATCAPAGWWPLLVRLLLATHPLLAAAPRPAAEAVLHLLRRMLAWRPAARPTAAEAAASIEAAVAAASCPPVNPPAQPLPRLAHPPAADTPLQ